jgi:hypothetical protein
VIEGVRTPGVSDLEAWPSLPLEEWQDTYATLHLWTQIVGKIRMSGSPLVNHWWNVTLHVTPRGLTTARIPHGTRTFRIDFDFLDHRLVIATNDGATRTLHLAPRSVADFYKDLMANLKSLGLDVKIQTIPQEIEDRTPFEKDEHHASYDKKAVERLHRVLVQADRVLNRFRAPFLGKVSPVHFFWGSFDLAVTRFSGRPAPPHPGGLPNVSDSVTREAYSHEVSSAGFWPGAGYGQPAFYSYAYPSPPGFQDRPVRPEAASWDTNLGEFLLPYEAVRQSPDPDAALLDFLQSTYEAAADAAGWDRAALER